MDIHEEQTVFHRYIIDSILDDRLVTFQSLIQVKSLYNSRAHISFSICISKKSNIRKVEYVCSFLSFFMDILTFNREPT